MKILKSATVSWKEVIVIKLYVLLIGIAIGAYWSSIFVPFALALFVVGFVLGLYSVYSWFKK